MTQIGVGIGVNKSPVKQTIHRDNGKNEVKKSHPDHLSKSVHYKQLNKQLSNNSSDRRLTNENIDDEDSNEFESHSDPEANGNGERKSTSRRGMNVNWGNHPTTTISSVHSKPMSNMKSFAHSIYRNPIRLNGLTSTSKTKATTGNPSASALTPIASETELSVTRILPAPQPRPETLAIMPEELFNERLKARQSPMLTQNETVAHSPLSVKQILSNLDQASNDGLAQWQSEEHGVDIPFIDETDFEDLGYILHRRCVGTTNEETIVYKSATFIKHEQRAKSSGSTPVNGDYHEICGNVHEAEKTLLESPMFDRVELITYASTNPHPSSEKIPLRHCSLRHVPREILLRSASPPVASPNAELPTTSTIIFVAKAKSPLVGTPVKIASPSSNHRHADVERALTDFYRCSQINDVDDVLTTSDSEVLSTYREMNHETISLLRLTEQYSSAFIDDELQIPCANNLMKMIILNKSNLETTSDEQTLTNSISLNTYSQDYSVDKIFRPSPITEGVSRKSWTSSSSASSSQDRPIPQHFLTTMEKKRTTSSDSDAITTTTTTLTTSTVYGG